MIIDHYYKNGAAMPFNTNALITLLLSDNLSIEAFQQALNETDTPNFGEVNDTLRSTLSETLGVDLADREPSALFLATLHKTIIERLHSPTPGLLLMATLEKLHELKDDHYLTWLASAMTMAASLPAESSVILAAPALPFTLTHPHAKTLKSNVLRLMTTTRITEKQIQCYDATDAAIEKTMEAPAFEALLKHHALDWENNEDALNALLPNEDGLFTAMGFFHAIWKTDLCSKIARLALKKGRLHPLPYIPVNKNINSFYYPFLASHFLDPKTTTEQFQTLVAAFRFRRISLNHDFNQTLLETASKYESEVTEEKLGVLMHGFSWSPNERYVVSTATDGTPAPQSLMDEILKLRYTTTQANVLSGLSVLLTLPTITLDETLTRLCVNSINCMLDNRINIKNIPTVIKHLLQNPGLNHPDESASKMAVFNQIVDRLNKHLSRPRSLGLLTIIFDVLLHLRFDNESLQRLIETIQRQHNKDACAIFDAIIHHPLLTDAQRAELTFKTKNKREDSDELLMWPEPITKALAEQPEVVALRTAIVDQHCTGLFGFSETQPYLPANKDFAYHLLPLALTQPLHAAVASVLLSSNHPHFFQPRLSLLVFRNNQLKPTHKGLCNPNIAYDNTFLLNFLLFSLLGHTPVIFNLPAEENPYCLDSYTDAIIRLTIHTKVQPNRFSFLDMLSILRAQYNSAISANLRALLSLTSLAKKDYYHTIERKQLVSAFYETFKKYIEASPTIRAALYQKMLLGERCVMEGALFNEEVPQNDRIAAAKALRETAVLPETLTALKSTLDVRNVSDFRSAILLIALSEHADLNEMITQHLLHKTLNAEEKKQLIDALLFLPQETFAALKETVIAWLTENSERRLMTRQLIDNQSHETNPLLLILRVGKTSYIPKETKHYKKLKTQLQADVSALQPKEPMEEELQSMRAPREEPGLSAEAIKRKSIEFIEANAQGKVTWSNTAPFLPVSMPEGLLPLEQFSLAGLSMYELLNHLSHPALPRLFILFILRHETLPMLYWDHHNQPSQKISFVYLIAFTLFGKDAAVFQLEADEKYHLLSYQAALIKQAIESSQPPIRLFHDRSVYGENIKTCDIPAYVPKNSFLYAELETITHETLVSLYKTYVEKSASIAAALYQNYLLQRQCLLFPLRPGGGMGPSSSAKRTETSTKKEICKQQASEETLRKIKERIDYNDKDRLNFDCIINLVPYLALSPDITDMDDKIKRHLVDKRVDYKLKENILLIVGKLSPEKIAHLKYQLNAYCARHKEDESGQQLALAINAKDKSQQPVLLWLLTIGQTSLKVKSNGHYITQLGLFFNNKPIEPKNAEKYGLPKPQ